MRPDAGREGVGVFPGGEEAEGCDGLCDEDGGAEDDTENGGEAE